AIIGGTARIVRRSPLPASHSKVAAIHNGRRAFSLEMAAVREQVPARRNNRKLEIPPDQESDQSAKHTPACCRLEISRDYVGFGARGPPVCPYFLASWFGNISTTNVVPAAIR